MHSFWRENKKRRTFLTESLNQTPFLHHSFRCSHSYNINSSLGHRHSHSFPFVCANFLDLWKRESVFINSEHSRCWLIMFLYYLFVILIKMRRLSTDLDENGNCLPFFFCVRKIGNGNQTYLNSNLKGPLIALQYFYMLGWQMTVDIVSKNITWT